MSESLPIQPAQGPIDATVRLPGSKSITNRALLLAALADGSCRITHALFADDTRYTAAALERLGFAIDRKPTDEEFTVQGRGGIIPEPRADLFVGNAGTAMRFLAAFVALGHGRYRLDGVPRMRQRPIAGLLAALETLGVRAIAENDDGCPPIRIETDGLPGGSVTMRADISSQYLSAVLLASPLSRDGVTVTVDGKVVSEPYVAMTVRMLRQWGIHVEKDGPTVYHVPGGQSYTAREVYEVEPDASSASYFMAAAAVTGGRVRVEGLGLHPLQGDVEFASVLEQAGCRITRTETALEVQGTDLLHGVDVDMNAISDTVMTLAAIAPFADGPTTIRNVAHVRVKESDRLAALATELRKLGADVEERSDGLTIYPAPSCRPAEIDTYDDHRMAMSFAIAGLRSPGVVIRDPSCVAKTFPDFFRRLREVASTAGGDALASTQP